MNSRILVAGIGNIFFGDDAFGCEVVRQLLLGSVPRDVFVRDFGIRGYDLAYAIMDDYRATILVDAAPRGQAPGTVYLIEPDLDNLDGARIPDGHGMNPVGVLQLVRSLGGEPRHVYLVGCEPAVLEPAEGEMGLSAIVAAAVPPALELIQKLIHDLLGQPQNPPSSLVEATER